MDRKVRALTIGVATLCGAQILATVAFASPMSSNMRVAHAPTHYCTSHDVLSAYADGTRLHCAFVESREYSYAMPPMDGGGALTISGVNGI